MVFVHWLTGLVDQCARLQRIRKAEGDVFQHSQSASTGDDNDTIRNDVCLMDGVLCRQSQIMQREMAQDSQYTSTTSSMMMTLALREREK